MYFIENPLSIKPLDQCLSTNPGVIAYSSDIGHPFRRFSIRPVVLAP